MIIEFYNFIMNAKFLWMVDLSIKFNTHWISGRGWIVERCSRSSSGKPPTVIELPTLCEGGC